MEEKISKSKYLFVTLILCLVIVFNFIYWHNPISSVVFGLLYLIFYSFIFGSIFIVKKGWQVIPGLLALLGLIAILGGLTIYLYQFNDYLFIFLIILIPALLITPYYYITPKEKFSLKKIILDHFDKILERKEPKINIALVFAYLTLAVICFSWLTAGQTVESIQSPWQIVSNKFFILYFLATVIILTYTMTAKRTKLPLALIVIHTFLSTAVALIVYKIGYGFDPFIHQATEKIINSTGTITPLPLYYLGQYALVVFLSKLTLLDISLVDKLLVPVLASLILPLITYFVFGFWLKRNYALTLALVILVVPFSSFIMTAPQNLANLFFVATILISLLYFRGDIKIPILYLLALATISIHPLAGIPLIITIFLFGLFKFLSDSYRQHLSLFFFASLVFIFSLPLAFVVNGSNLNFQQPKLDFKNPIQLVNKFDLALDIVYFINFNKAWLAGLVIIIGLAYLSKHKLLKNNAAYLIAGFVVFANYFIVRYFLTFPELNDYDQTGFIQRILTLSFYLLLPLFLIGLQQIIKKFWDKDVFTKFFIILVISSLITISFYLSYPRANQYEPAKFFSVSDSDIKVVKLIEQSAAPEHIVLANQMIGAAAIKELGFKKYYNNQFYYSMPMGNPKTLYDLYLEMIYEGARKETMLKAMDEAGVDEAYFVLNQYWRDSEKIASQARASANQVYLIDNGKVYIFKYLR
ncbi:MAG: hypothetical protein A2731_03820 [Candidatus Buchananbacteria bacterium RIFCSPHIGHO2_01_FULL_39_8]|uniref:Glycosyltransferase RgtA/B/C/D-like domain-containing protein n=1 Tax=Candidatus Buchananbacteria bacterium RIFCSPHIGHO2_01_FULL_39_8 TaxID=1797533 RepID=A0A1G1XVB2_9BACT|nr:MAG: hypothetical protein A2731_03820 [Candidatus Buchananbacteria bacterium RIFCSPHIGHO2_01_FULL_39_8]